MIGLQFIVKVYNGTYKKLAEKLEIAPPTIMAWLSNKRPIPKAKLEALSKLFKIEEEYFTKELNEVEKIQIQKEYLRRLSRRESFEMPDFITDDDGVTHEYTRWVDPYEDERRMLDQELQIEALILSLRSMLYTELYANNISDVRRTLETLERLSELFDEELPEDLNESEQRDWLQRQNKRMSAIRSLIYYMVIPQRGFGQFMRGQDAIDDDIYDLIVKHDLKRD
ncbi:helix-turn-helix domain-containing protein [Paenibacillus silvisoli]|uniref:hypothetical protein n=1 Tax=Paenibacillus silvisoli TaxID=3110539 RepID=UPI0028054C89|nr:hypothetical protein [Paenibacillus silvisoli]